MEEATFTTYNLNIDTGLTLLIDAALGRPNACCIFLGTTPPQVTGEYGMPWLILFVAGLLEMVWALMLKQSEGFTKPVPTLVFFVSLVLSMFLLSQALKTLPVGTAYAVWTGIGAAGTAILGMLLFGESRDVLKLISLVMIVGGIIGLRLASSQ